MNIEQIEKKCAETLLAYAESMADACINEPDDLQACMTAMLGRALEIHLNRRINLENLWPKKQLSDAYKTAHLRLTN